MTLLEQMKDILNQAHAQAWKLTAQNNGTAPDEPGLISQISSSTVASAMQAAINLFPASGPGVRALSATFIHQTPQATTVHGTSELGDLLLIVINERSGYGRAAFLQAKKTRCKARAH